MNTDAIKRMAKCFNGTIYANGGVWMDSTDEFETVFLAANSGEELIAGLETAEKVWGYIEDGDIVARFGDGFSVMSVNIKCGCARCQ